MGAWLWRAADGVESMTCGLGWFVPLKILTTVRALIFMMRTPYMSPHVRRMYNNSDTRKEFCVRPLNRGSPSYPSLWVVELLRIVAPDRLGHLPSPSGGLRFLTLPRVPQRSRQSFTLLLKSWMALVLKLQHRDIDWCGELGERQQHPGGRLADELVEINPEEFAELRRGGLVLAIGHRPTRSSRSPGPRLASTPQPA
jgi:hypothetical protein